MVDAPSQAPLLDPQFPLAAPLRHAVSHRIDTFLARQASELTALQPEIGPVLAMASRLLAGGKRLRPAFCVWGYVAAAGLDPNLVDCDPEDPAIEAVLIAAGSLELLHVSALVHDDVIDGSDTRRGAPAAHRQFEDLHRGQDRLGEPGGFGRAGAILLGDLLMMWSVEMLENAGLSAQVAALARPIAQAMRTEVICGQYLDVLAQSRRWDADAERALAEGNRIVEYKSARYTVYRPAQLGAAIGGADPRVHEVLARYGSPLGRAFQFRDDLLGVFGDPAVTGKPVGEDLREGKRTVLIATTMAHTDRAGRDLLVRLLGDPDLDDAGVTALQQTITASGAREALEARITAQHRDAVAALADPMISESGRSALTALASAAIHRDT
ncbi:MAG: polyprenyl synthetase family protein [Microlunatus sp.]|nr:polyprenyl synthetase family protein [Microlunatus sp.]MDN5771900.1 polyprenyl synthetase family protein [Microlunatus sp.]